MAHDGPRAADRLDEAEPNGRLDSWKEIAAYLKRDVTTVRRWEKREGLPVHRHLHDRRDSVYAYLAEVDGWWKSRRIRLTPDGQHGLVLNDAPDNGESPGNGVATPSVGRSNVARVGWALAATFFVTTLALGVLLLLGEASTTPDGDIERRFSVLPPPGTTFVDHVVSPDGRYLAFTAIPNEGGHVMTTLWVRALDSLEAQELPDTEGASLPFWSPTSDALGFFAEGHLWTVGLSGGAPRSLVGAPQGRGGTWNRDGTIVFAPGRDGGLSRVSSEGGGFSTVTTLGEGERSHAWPEFLPDGRHFAYVVYALLASRTDDDRVFVAALDGSQQRQILTAQSGVLPMPDGYLYYRRERKLLAQPFDLRRFDVTGEPVALADDVMTRHAHPPKHEFSVSSGGILTFQVPQNSATRLLWRDRAGRSSPLINIPADYYDPTFAPDETRVAFAVFDPKPSSRFGFGLNRVSSNIYVLDRKTGVSSQLTSHPAGEWSPVWAPDGRSSMVFSSSLPDDTLQLILKDEAVPHGTQVTLVTEGSTPLAQSWSPNGDFLLYTTVDPKTRIDLWLLPMSGDRTPIPLLNSEFNETQGQVSPDGRWFAYMSDESGREEVYISTFPKPTTKRLVSTAGGADPRWRPDGKELYYVSEDRQLMAVPVTIGATFSHGTATPLFDIGVPPHWYGARNLYDVSRDGRFLTMSPVQDDRSLPVTIVLNWAARLRK